MKRKLYLSLFVFLMLAVQAFAGIRVMSFNVRLGVAKDHENCWEIRKYAVPEMLRDIKPDVFGVQEAYNFQLAWILDKCPEYKCVGVGRDNGLDEGEHMSVFYNADKFELVEWGTYWLSETPEVPSFGWDAMCRRTATWTLLKEKKNGKQFFFVNTHLDHRGKVARKKGLELLYNRITAMNPDGWPMVLTGDFNILPDNEGLADINKLMHSARFDAKKADTCGSFNNFGKKDKSAAPTLDKEPEEKLIPLDYIYYAGYDKCTQFRVVRKRYAGVPYISDHYPVFADLK